MPTIQVRVTDEQKAQLEVEAAAYGLKLSTWIKVHLFGKRSLGPVKPGGPITVRSGEKVTPRPKGAPTTKPPAVAPQPQPTTYVEFRPVPKPSSKKK